MPTSFDKREEEFERKYAHEEELRFKAVARRNKMLAQWAAGKLGLSAAETEAYVAELVRAAIVGGEREVFAKLRRDFDAKGVVQSDHQIRRTMDDLLAQALAQVRVSG